MTDRGSTPQDRPGPEGSREERGRQTTRLGRRRFVAAAAAAGIAGLAGCTGGGGDGGGDGGGGDGGSGNKDTTAATTDAMGSTTTAGTTDTTTESMSGTTEGTTTDGSTTTEATTTEMADTTTSSQQYDDSPPISEVLPDHPATANVDAQPVAGDTEASAVIVAFEDPSCPLCGRFETSTYPQIESNLIEPGKAAFVYRGYPVVYPWGEPASHALEATYARSEGAFWKLKDYYYRNQSDLGSRNLLDKTFNFLATNTGVDPQAVVDAADAKSQGDAVGADLDAGKAAGAGSTPYFFLFKNGSFRTEISGPQDYRVFETSLGV